MQNSSSEKQYDVIVVGGGLAGLSTAHELLERNRRVLLLESNPVLGGRTGSWDEDGMPVESGLHRYLHFYKYLPRLMKACGIPPKDVVYWEDEVIVQRNHKQPHVVGASLFFNARQTLKSIFADADFLSYSEKFALLRFYIDGFRQSLTRPLELDEQDILAFARKHKLTENAIKNIVIPLSSGLFFLHPENYSAYHYFHPFIPMVTRLPRLRVGAFLGGMSGILANPIAASLKKRGAEIRVSSEVTDLIVEHGRVVGVVVHNQQIKAQEVVLATHIEPAKNLLRPHFNDMAWFRNIDQLPMMSAVTLQVELKAPIMPIDRVIFAPESPLNCYAEQSHSTFRGLPGRLSIILSPPDPFLDMPHNKIFDLACEEAPKLGIDLRNLAMRWRVIIERNAFASIVPGNERYRVEQKTPIPGLTLAGDWTKQDMSYTMEGAVISGRKAARAIVGEVDESRFPAAQRIPKLTATPSLF